MFGENKKPRCWRGFLFVEQGQLACPFILTARG
jgi:hypothetical protein